MTQLKPVCAYESMSSTGVKFVRSIYVRARKPFVFCKHAYIYNKLCIQNYNYTLLAHTQLYLHVPCTIIDNNMQWLGTNRCGIISRNPQWPRFGSKKINHIKMPIARCGKTYCMQNSCLTHNADHWVEGGIFPWWVWNHEHELEPLTLYYLSVCKKVILKSDISALADSISKNLSAVLE